MLLPLFAILATSLSLTGAVNSPNYHLKARSAGHLRASPINSTTYKLSIGPGGATNFYVRDVDQSQSATLIANGVGIAASPEPAELDIWRLDHEDEPSAQVFVRTDRHRQRTGLDEITISDSRLHYYDIDGYVYIFYFCETPIVTQDLEEGTTTLFMRRSEMPLPDGCWDSYLEVTRQGASGSPP